MKGMCQTCGATAPLEWFLNEPVSRQVLVVALQLPKAVQEHIIGYLSLFRPQKNSLSPKKALRLVTEIRDLVGQGYVHVRGKIDRTTHSGHWGEAMEQMVATRHGLSLPMANHVYLTKIVWDLADADDSKKESAVRKREQESGVRSPEPAETAVSFAGISPELLARLPAKVREKYGV